MPTPVQPIGPSSDDTARQLRLLALRLMDAAEEYEEHQLQRGRAIALEVAAEVKRLLQAS